MEEFINYVASFDPEFTYKISGAHESKIEYLEELIQKKLPPEYKDYLSYMGESNGDFFLFQPTERSNIETIIEGYQDVYKGEWEIPDDCILICDYIYPNEQLALRESEDSKRTVWRLDEGEWYVDMYAESLKGLLWRQAFIEYALKEFNHRGYWQIYVNNESKEVDLVKEKLNQWSIQKLWFSDGIFHCAQGDKMRVVINTYGGGCHIYFSTKLQSIFDEFDDYLVKQIDAKYRHSF